MSLGNDPSQVPPAEEPDPEDCRYCPRQTYDPRRICPDCRFEGSTDELRGVRSVPVVLLSALFWMVITA